jgi:hypothetical protein
VAEKVEDVIKKYVKQLTKRKSHRNRNYDKVFEYLKAGIAKKSFNNVRDLYKNERLMGKDADLEWVKHKF